MTEITYTLTRGDEDIELDVEYSVAPYYPATWHDPAEGGEITEMTVTRDGEPFALTDEEQNALDQWVYDHHDYDDDYEYSEPWEE